jgi:hypothetical protein
MTEIEIDNARLLLNAELANTIFVKESLKERQYR